MLWRCASLGGQGLVRTWWSRDRVPSGPLPSTCWYQLCVRCCPRCLWQPSAEGALCCLPPSHGMCDVTHAHCVCDSVNAGRSGHTSEPVDRVGLDRFGSPGGTCLAGGLTGEEEAGEAPRAELLRSPGWACSGDRPVWPQQAGSCVRGLSSGVGLGYYLRVMGALGVLSAEGMWSCLHFSRSSLAGCLWSRV